MTLNKKPHILFFTEKWCDFNPSVGPGNNQHNLLGSLEASDLATYETFYYDEFWYSHHASCESSLLAKCEQSKPNLIVISWTHIPSHPASAALPNKEVFNHIRASVNSRIVAVWFDTVNTGAPPLGESFLPYVDLNIILDSSSYLNSSQLEKYLHLWTPQDHRLFYNPELNRDINISFVGSRNRPDRTAGINAIKNSGIDIYESGGQREMPLSVHEYAEIFMRSKIAVNFSLTVGNHHQCKGRVFEATLCGAMLLESENTETAKWFEPMVEYVSFTNEDDLVEKVRYYLRHESERQEIANRGYQKAQEKYTGYTFWKTIFKKLNLINGTGETKEDQVRQIIYRKNEIDIGNECPENRALTLSFIVRKVAKNQMKILEVGSWKGQSTAILASVAHEYKGMLFAVDHWQGSPGVEHLQKLAKEEDVFSIFRKNLSFLDLWQVVHPLVMKSETAFQIFDNNVLDLVLIDGDHRYSEVKKDLLMWLTKVKNGGIICGVCADGYYSTYSSEIQQQINDTKENDFIAIPIGGVHPGVVKALYDVFQDKHRIMAHTDIWYYQKKNWPLD